MFVDHVKFMLKVETAEMEWLDSVVKNMFLLVVLQVGMEEMVETLSSIVDEGLRTLMDFRYKRHFKATRGVHGGSKNMHGADADDLIVKVPPGTVVTDEETGEVIADLVEHGQTAIIARGGRGGRGNSRFATPANPAPELSEKGEPGLRVRM